MSMLLNFVLLRKPYKINSKIF